MFHKENRFHRRQLRLPVQFLFLKTLPRQNDLNEKSILYDSNILSIIAFGVWLAVRLGILGARFLGHFLPVAVPCPSLRAAKNSIYLC